MAKKGQEKESTRGGSRKGAGRPVVFGVRINWIVRLPADVAIAAEAKRKELSLSQSQLCELALKELLKLP